MLTEYCSPGSWQSLTAPQIEVLYTALEDFLPAPHPQTTDVHMSKLVAHTYRASRSMQSSSPSDLRSERGWR